MSISFGFSERTRPSRLTLYLASKDRNGNDVEDIHDWVDRAQRMFARLVGGATVIHDAQDLWYARKQGIYIEETIAIITSYVSRDYVVTHLDTLRTFFRDILIGTGQEAVVVDLDGDPH